MWQRKISKREIKERWDSGKGSSNHTLHNRVKAYCHMLTVNSTGVLYGKLCPRC